jgi:hypothetical protein
VLIVGSFIPYCRQRLFARFTGQHGRTHWFGFNKVETPLTKVIVESACRPLRPSPTARSTSTSTMKLALTGALPLYLALLCAKVIPANATCYNLDRSEAPDDVPCQTSGTSNCCNKKDICLTNGLCYLQGSPPNALSRGSCTDMNWGPACYAPCCTFPLPSLGRPLVRSLNADHEDNSGHQSKKRLSDNQHGLRHNQSQILLRIRGWQWLPSR